MAHMARVHEIALLAVIGFATTGIASTTAQTPASQKPSSNAAPGAKLTPDEVDGLIAPVALYPDQLLAQMLVSATTPARVKELDAWLKTNPPFTGTALQDAARQAGYEPSLVALVLFPQVVDFMATNLDWTTEVGRAVSSDRAAVLDSVQRLRADALASGKLKTTPQQTVSLKTLDSGQNIIVIDPANAQVVYVPQYDPKTVYTEVPTSTTVIIQEEDDDDAEAMAAGLIGFSVGIAIGAAIDNDYYYGPYGWHGAPYMYNDAWDDWYDDREDAREDWYEHREDAREDVLENREDLAETRSERAANAQEQRTERTETRTERTQTQTQTARSGASSYAASGQTRERSSTAAARSGTSSDAFSNYSSGRSERSASARGKSSRSSGSRSSGRRRR
jgi:hypothetical protein